MDRCITEASRPKRQLAFTALATCSFFAASHAAPAATPSPDEIARSAARIEADVRDVVPIGIEHSTLETVALRAVADAGLTLTPDPLPEEVVFVRSDQYPLRPRGNSGGLPQVGHQAA
jgi:hypothetical protein